MSSEDDVETIPDALVASFVFFYRNGLELIGLSVAWVIASIPIVTVGAATLGAYAAIHSLRETGKIDVSSVLGTIRRQGLNAALSGFVVVLVGGISFLYFSRYVTSESLVFALLGTAGLYIAIHLQLVLIPTFVGLVKGSSFVDALRRGYRWTVMDAKLALGTLLVSLVLLAVSALLMVTVVLVFPALVFTFHIEVLSEEFRQAREADSPEDEADSARRYADPTE